MPPALTTRPPWSGTSFSSSSTDRPMNHSSLAHPIEERQGVPREDFAHCLLGERERPKLSRMVKVMVRPVGGEKDRVIAHYFQQPRIVARALGFLDRLGPESEFPDVVAGSLGEERDF